MENKENTDIPGKNKEFDKIQQEIKEGKILEIGELGIKIHPIYIENEKQRKYN